MDSTLYASVSLLTSWSSMHLLHAITSHQVQACRCEDESIDELAAYLGFGEQVAALTARYGTQLRDIWTFTESSGGLSAEQGPLAACSAMGGTVLFQDALAQRLGLMSPSRQQLDAFLADHPPRISKGAGSLSTSTVSLHELQFQ